MNIQIKKPDVAQRFTMHIRTGQFRDADELIEKALDALDQHKAATSDVAGTGAVVLAALQASPYRDIELAPSSVRLDRTRDVVL